MAKRNQRRSNPPVKFKPGDLVRYTTKFLRSTGQITGVPVDGVVVGRGSLGPYVVWSDREFPLQVAAGNLQKKKTSSSRKDVLALTRIVTGLPIGGEGYAYTVYEGSSEWPGKVRPGERFDKEKDAVDRAVVVLDKDELDVAVLDPEGVVVFAMKGAGAYQNPVPFSYGLLLPEERELLMEILASDEDPYTVAEFERDAAEHLDTLGFVNHLAGDEFVYLTPKGEMAGRELLAYTRGRRRKGAALASRMASGG